MFSFYSAAPLRDPHPFPTRRSSDLWTRTNRRHAGATFRAANGPEMAATADGHQATHRRSAFDAAAGSGGHFRARSEEHTSELQSLTNLVCRLLLEKKNKQKNITTTY